MSEEREKREREPSAEAAETAAAAAAAAADDKTSAADADAPKGAVGAKAASEATEGAASGSPADSEGDRSSTEGEAGATERPGKRAVREGVVVRARARYVRRTPRKVRLVINHVRGKPVEEARALLRNTTRAAARDVLKLIDSAVANAENQHELTPQELRVARIWADEGPTIKRWRPRAFGRATRIDKRTSHITVELEPIVGGR